MRTLPDPSSCDYTKEKEIGKDAAALTDLGKQSLRIQSQLSLIRLISWSRRYELSATPSLRVLTLEYSQSAQPWPSSSSLL
jgi:O-succinylbenzoate synthase